MAKVNSAARAAKQPTARNLSTFAASHDRDVIIPNRIKAALESMRKEGGDEFYEYEAEFVRRAGINGQYLAQFRAQFAPHIVVVRQDIGSRSTGKKVWFATAKAATAARGGPADPAAFE